MKKLFYTVLLQMFISSLIGQTFKIEYQQGYGSYSMKDLKQLNETISSELQFTTGIENNFPMYWFFRPSISLVFKNYEIAINYGFQSTGSRVSAKDYSGEYFLDLEVESHSPGILIAIKLNDFNQFSLNLYTNVGVYYTNLKLEESFTLDNESLINESISLKGFNYFFEPGLRLNYPINSFNLALNAGYNIQLGEQGFYAENNKKYELRNPNTNNIVSPGWNGIRIGLAIGYTFNKRKTKIN